jgi:ribosomal protein L13
VCHGDVDHLDKHLVKRLKVYQGDQHPHGAQDPKFLDVL